MINSELVRNATPRQSSKNGYETANPGMFLPKRSYLEKVMLKPLILSNFKNENNMKNNPIYVINQLSRLKFRRSVWIDKDETITIVNASNIGFLEFKCDKNLENKLAF